MSWLSSGKHSDDWGIVNIGWFGEASLEWSTTSSLKTKTVITDSKGYTINMWEWIMNCLQKVIVFKKWWMTLMQCEGFASLSMQSCLLLDVVVKNITVSLSSTTRISSFSLGQRSFLRSKRIYCFLVRSLTYCMGPEPFPEFDWVNIFYRLKHCLGMLIKGGIWKQSIGLYDIECVLSVNCSKQWLYWLSSHPQYSQCKHLLPLLHSCPTDTSVQDRCWLVRRAVTVVLVRIANNNKVSGGNKQKWNDTSHYRK